MSLLLKKVFKQSVHDEYTSLFPQINLISITSVVCLYSMRYKYEGLSSVTGVTGCIAQVKLVSTGSAVLSRIYALFGVFLQAVVVYQ